SKWSSLSAWLPLVSGIGVISYLLHARRDWLKKMILISFFMALIPGLNSAFIMFNYSYYARWFYMPVLLFCVATVIAFENKRVNLYRGIRWCTFAVLIFTVAIGLTPYQKEGAWKIGLMDKTGRFWLFVSIALACLLISYLIIEFARNTKWFKPIFLVAILSVSIITWIQYMALDKQGASGVGERINVNMAGREQIDLEDDSVYRSDFFEIEENMGMYWKLPNIQAFHSIVPTSIMEFYPEVGVKRDVSSKPGVEHFALRSLLSVKYLFIKESNANQTPMEGFRFYKSQMGFNIYENENFIPFGFAYDYYFDDTIYENTHEGNRSRVMMRSLYLKEDAITRNQDIITKLPEGSEQFVSYEDFQSDVLSRKIMSTSNFTRDNRGFTADITMDKERLVFFSVPYEAGWSAKVNGQPVVIEKANIGFMAVRVPAGTSKIRFNYMTNGLPMGLLITLIGLIIFGLYVMLYRRYSKKQKQKMLEEAVIAESIDTQIIL
ncbi:MAG: YfhO family protein, partial [Oscillospiraceae bacterium]